MKRTTIGFVEMTAIIATVAFFSFGIGYMMRPIEVARAQSSTAPAPTGSAIGDGNPVGFLFKGPVQVTVNGSAPPCLVQGTTGPATCDLTISFSVNASEVAGCATHCDELSSSAGTLTVYDANGGTPYNLGGVTGTVSTP